MNHDGHLIIAQALAPNSAQTSYTTPRGTIIGRYELTLPNGVKIKTDGSQEDHSRALEALESIGPLLQNMPPPAAAPQPAAPAVPPSKPLTVAGLHERGLLTKSSADTLHEHRYLGNSAVHELARPADVELKLAVEILEHTLDALYEMPEKAAQLRSKRKS